MSNIIWNYDDVASNLLVVQHGKQTIGYFRIDKGDFVMISDLITVAPLSINILRSIVNGYDDALKEAKSMLESTLPALVIKRKFTYPMELDAMNYVIEIYEDTVDRLICTGIGNKTEHDTVVTEKMISTIISRMQQLKAQRLHLLKY